jgi:hypothetical protein
MLNRYILAKTNNEPLLATECSLHSMSVLYFLEIYCSTWVGHITHMGERRGAYGVLVGKPEGTRPFERPRHRWVDNIKMDLQEVGRVDLAEGRYRWQALVSVVMTFRLYKMWGIS